MDKWVLYLSNYPVTREISNYYKNISKYMCLIVASGCIGDGPVDRSSPQMTEAHFGVQNMNDFS